MVERYDLCDRGFDNYYIGKCPNGDWRGEMSDLIETLRLACDDPMWADHVEMPKKLLRHAVDYLDALKKQVEELTAEANRLESRLKVADHTIEMLHGPLSVAALTARADAAEAEAVALRKERDRLNGCLNLANERTDENFDQAVKNAFIAAKLRRENEALRKALGPFANFAEEQVLITENMWLDGAQRERIGDWFGPTAFADAYRAQAALASTRETSDAG